MAIPCSANASGGYRPPPRPDFEITDCDLKRANSSFVSANMKSEGNRFMFLRTAWTSALALCKPPSLPQAAQEDSGFPPLRDELCRRIEIPPSMDRCAQDCERSLSSRRLRRYRSEAASGKNPAPTTRAESPLSSCSQVDPARIPSETPPPPRTVARIRDIRPISVCRMPGDSARSACLNPPAQFGP